MPDITLNARSITADTNYVNIISDFEHITAIGAIQTSSSTYGADSDLWIMPTIERFWPPNDLCGYDGAYITSCRDEEPAKEVTEDEFDDVIKELCS